MSVSGYLRVERLPGGRGAIATVTTEKVGGREAAILQNELGAAAEDSDWRLGVDLSGVTLLSSVGRGALVLLHKQAREMGGVLVVCGIEKELMSVLKVTHLDRVLMIVRDRNAASGALA